MTKSTKMKSYDSFSGWKKDQSPKNQKLITEVTKIIKNAAPKLETTVKWSQGCWAMGKEHKLFIHGAQDHIQLGFYVGSKLRDPKKILQGNGKFVRHVKIFSEKDIDERAFKNLIKQVI